MVTEQSFGAFFSYFVFLLTSYQGVLKRIQKQTEPRYFITRQPVSEIIKSRTLCLSGFFVLVVSIMTLY